MSNGHNGTDGKAKVEAQPTTGETALPTQDDMAQLLKQKDAIISRYKKLLIVVAVVLYADIALWVIASFRPH